jgi:hypothetical protein
MKICIAINSFKNEDKLLHHEKLCVQSLRKLKEKYNDIDLINLLFEKDSKNLDLQGFENLRVLKTESKNIFPNYKKNLSCINEMFDYLANLNYDYFIFINNDILVSDRFIKEVNDNPEFDSFIASKLCFTKLDSIDDKTAVPVALSVHGFDAFAIKCKWWKTVSDKFEKFFIGKPYWDTYFFTKCYLTGKCKVLNKAPACIFHMAHGEGGSDAEDELSQFNVQSFKKDEAIGRIWFTYAYAVLLKREKFEDINWYIPFANEVELEKYYLKY